MSTRFTLCSVTPQALPQVKAEFERQGFHDFEVSISDTGKLILSAIAGAPQRKDRGVRVKISNRKKI